MTGGAFVSFATAEEARSAQTAKDRFTLGGRYMELFHTSPEELVWSLIEQQYQPQRSQPDFTAACKSTSSVATSSIISSETKDTTASIINVGSLNNNIDSALLKVDDDRDLVAAEVTVWLIKRSIIMVRTSYPYTPRSGTRACTRISWG